MERLEIRAGPYVFDARATGPAEGQVVLLLHGFPQTSSCWRHQLDALGEAGYRAVAPDQRGYSPRAAPREVAAYRSGELVGDVLAIADHVGADRFHLVGHDWGGVIAWQVAGRHPERLHSLTAVSTPHPRAFARALRGREQRLRAAYTKLLQSPIAEPLLTAFDARMLRTLLRRSGLADDDVALSLRKLGSRQHLRGPLHWYRAADASLVKGLGEVTAPTLYVWSTDEPVFSRQAAEETANHVTGPYRFEILHDVGHWIHQQAAPALTGLLLDHLAADYGETRYQGTASP